MPAISVIVPVYNVEPYLHRCVESILQQTFTDFELILVDDGSPDNCPAICDQYAAQDKRVHVIHQKNGGLSAARNAGIDWAFAHSDSEWITFIDSDDWVHLNYLKWMHETVLNLKVNVCFCASKRIKRENEIPEVLQVYPQMDSAVKLYTPETKGIHLFSSCAKLYRKKQWENIRFPVGKLHEDRFTTHKLIFQNQFVGIITQELYYYYINNNSITHSGWSITRFDDLEGIQEQLKFFRENKLEDAWKVVAISHLWALYEMITDISKADVPDRKNDIILHKQLRKVLREYRKKIDLPIKKYGYIYDMAYPFWMRQYWRVQKILKLLHLK